MLSFFSPEFSNKSQLTDGAAADSRQQTQIENRGNRRVEDTSKGRGGRMGDWCTIESDPAVFSELIENFGVKDVAVEEIYSMEEIPKDKKNHGFIFLFKYQKDDYQADNRPIAPENETTGLFFARQTIQNACATQAILSVLFNSPSVDLGTSLSEFKEFTSEFDPESRGLSIGNSDTIRNAHNAFARPEVFVSDDEKYSNRGGKSEDAYHFIAYVPHKGNVYELDGLKPGPINLGAGDDWINVVKPAIEERMAKFNQNETAFALLTICERKETILNRELSKLSDSLMNTAEGTADKSRIEAEINAIQSELEAEAQKLKRDRQENVRRKHNYLQFIMVLLRALAKKGKLEGIISTYNSRRADVAANASGK